MNLALRHLVPCVVGSLFLASQLALAGQETEKAGPPDILLIMPDQWRGDALSVLGCSGVDTP